MTVAQESRGTTPFCCGVRRRRRMQLPESLRRDYSCFPFVCGITRKKKFMNGTLILIILFAGLLPMWVCSWKDLSHHIIEIRGCCSDRHIWDYFGANVGVWNQRQTVLISTSCTHTSECSRARDVLLHFPALVTVASAVFCLFQMGRCCHCRRRTLPDGGCLWLLKWNPLRLVQTCVRLRRVPNISSIPFIFARFVSSFVRTALLIVLHVCHMCCSYLRGLHNRCSPASCVKESVYVCVCVCWLQRY